MQKNIISSIFMVAGCAMGAGSLAMPLLAAGPNFVSSVIALILIAIFSYYLSYYSLEVYLIYKNGINASTIAHRAFGPKGVIFSAIINCSLMYAILMVYMIGGANLLSKTIFPIFKIHVSDQVGLIIFLIIFLPIFIKGTTQIIKANNLVFIIKLIAFLIALIVGFKYITHDILIINYTDLAYLPRALTVFFAALGFQILIPVIAEINLYNRKLCRKIFAWGIFIPLLLYISWIAVILSLIPRNGAYNSFYYLLSHHQSVGEMIYMATHNNAAIPTTMKIALNIFSNVALLTSFLTVGIALFEYIRDGLKISNTSTGRVKILSLTMGPPIFIAFFYPNSFMVILQQAAILLIITIMIPLAAILKPAIGQQIQIKFSKLAIYLLLILAGLLIILQILDNLNLLPNYGIN